jgi:hypothetical protein
MRLNPLAVAVPLFAFLVLLTLAVLHNDAPGGDLSDWTYTALGDVEAWIGEFTTLDWVLIALGVFGLVWALAALRAATHLGPIEVTLLDHDTNESSPADVHAVTAMLRERLAHSGLMSAPVVPAGGPQTELIAAVEAVPQAAPWLGPVLKMLPTPPQPPGYVIKGTLIGPRPGGGPSTDRCGVSVWLQPEREGRALLETKYGHDHDQAIRRAAARVFVHISNDAVHVFPTWARWRDEQAFAHYLDGVRAREAEDYPAAKYHFTASAGRDRHNALPRLALANLGELGALANGHPDHEIRAMALRRYLKIGVEQPELVEARYRASVLSAMLASECDDPAVSATVAKRVGLNDGSPEGVTATLRMLAQRESKAAYQMLKIWYVMLRKQRLRHHFEPKGFERRQLKRTVAISRHCLRARETLDHPTSLPWRRLAVRFWHLRAGHSTLSWHGRYNAACFYALMAGHRRLSADRRAAWRRRAYSNLYKALDEARGELRSDWLAQDRDLAVLQGDGDWQLLLQRHFADPDQRWELDRYPRMPWGPAVTRAARWMGAAVALAIAALALALVLDTFGDGGGAAIALPAVAAGAAVFAVLRGYLASAEPPAPEAPG